jgi:hypothetical protein
MAEKTGEIEKLIYDFNTAGVLEVYMPNLEGWYRTTAKDFRSFDGKRRITEPTKVEKGNPWVDLRTYEYNGPVFLWGTNMQLVEETKEGELITSPYWDKQNKISGSRG